MSGDSNNQDDWQACPPGEITRLVNRLNSRERRARFGQLATTGLVSMLLFAAGAILFGGFVAYEEPTYGGIACTDCLAHAAAYHDHLVGSETVADVELIGKIKTHLEMCSCCRAKFHQAYPDIPLDQLATTELRFRPFLPTLAIALSPANY